VFGCVVNFVMVGCTLIIVANCYICLLYEFAPQAVLFSNIFLKIKILNFRRLTIADRSYGGNFRRPGGGLTEVTMVTTVDQGADGSYWFQDNFCRPLLDDGS
jgi:hypothetical protein